MEKLAASINTDPNAPAKMLPLVAFNPLRELREPGHLDFVLNAVRTRGFVGIKVYPPCGFAPANNAADPALQKRELYGGKALTRGAAFDQILSKFFKTCEAEHIPVMAHASNSNGLRRNADSLASPWGWAEVLADREELRLNFAHFGHMEGASHVAGFKTSECVNWTLHIAELMSKYKGVYADIGYSGLMAGPGEFQQKYKQHLLDADEKSGQRLAGRLMYGSDWWMMLLETSGPSYFQQVSSWLTASFPGWTNLWNRNALAFLGLFDEKNQNRARIVAKWQPSFVAALTGDA